MEPSLSEIANIRVDPELGSGTPATVIDHRDMIRNLNQAAQQKAHYDWGKFQNFQKQLGDTLSDINKVQELDILTEDRPQLLEDRKKVFELIYKNPGAFSGKDPAKFAEIQSKYGELLGKATESKSFNGYDKAIRQYMILHPELETDENTATMEGERKKPLGVRRPYNITMPSIFDANVFTKELLAESTTGPYTDSQPVGWDKTTNKEIAGDEFIKDTTQTLTSFNKFINKWDRSLLMQNDKNGKPIRDYAQKRYDDLAKADPQTAARIASEATLQGKSPLEVFWRKFGEASFGGNRDANGVMQDIITKGGSKLTQNQNYLNKETLEARIANDKATRGIAWYNAQTGRLQEDRLAKAAGVSDQIANSAVAYAEGLMGKLKKLADEKGVISADKLKNLTSDELKYLGNATTTDNKFSLTPLNIKGVSSFKINEDGTVAVFKDIGIKDKKGNLTTENQQLTPFDVKNIALNKIGDEVSITTGKEGFNYNNLIPLYNAGKQPEQKSQVINGYEIPNGAQVVYSKKTGKALGYTLNGENFKF